jgi:hypothetical protein
MTTTTTRASTDIAELTSSLVSAYYDCWTGGAATYDEARVRGILAPDMIFEGPVAGHRVGAEPFITALGRIAAALTDVRMIRQFQSGNEAVALYDADLTKPEGTFRFAEYFRIENGKIQEIKLVFDATKFR